MAEPTESIDLVGQIIEGLDEGVFVTKFLLIAEVICEDGDRTLWVQTDDDAKRWDTYGLLLNALQEEKLAHAKARSLADEEEED